MSLSANKILKPLMLLLFILLLWQGVVLLFTLPSYLLPTPLEVFTSFWRYRDVILQQSLPTIFEAVLGFILGSSLGILAAVALAYSRHIRTFALPLLLISQALPTFAIAPLFVIWFGYGESSKIAVCILMLFFPVASAFYDGLRRTPKDAIDLAKTMDASAWARFYHIKIPYALPHLASGLRVAATFAPMGAIIGEWVGSSRGLGFLMLNANARMQIGMMFAVLVTVVFLTLAFYFFIDKLLRVFIPWRSNA